MNISYGFRGQMTLHVYTKDMSLEDKYRLAQDLVGEILLKDWYEQRREEFQLFLATALDESR